jgi:hypothetical protein
LIAAALVVFAQPALAQECEDGQVLLPGERCEVTVKWGYDHWVKADFPNDGASVVVFRHLEGKCNVSLFGPEELENDVLGPDLEPTSSKIPGEYHLFTRAITVAKEACRYSVAVD